MGVGGQRHPQSTLSPGKVRYPLYRGLGGPQCSPGQVRKISTPPGFDPGQSRPVASLYTDYATRPTVKWHTVKIISISNFAHLCSRVNVEVTNDL
jgi:hypothetical protein